ncbi:XRE family transcriptional regulator [Jonesia denitrificans]|nr:XRE family transcriptional regulator [Jonesia denitrificans]ASE08906.1 XRE family transcriptional regulator [Jonesia denitrificans]
MCRCCLFAVPCQISCLTFDMDASINVIFHPLQLTECQIVRYYFGVFTTSNQGFTMSRKKIADMTQAERVEAAATIADIRERLGISQQELSDATGISRQTISNIERGATRPNSKSLEKIFEALGVSDAPEFDAATEKWLVMVGTLVERIPAQRRQKAMDSTMHYLALSVGADIKDFVLAASEADHDKESEAQETQP